MSKPSDAALVEPTSKDLVAEGKLNAPAGSSAAAGKADNVKSKAAKKAPADDEENMKMLLKISAGIAAVLALAFGGYKLSQRNEDDLEAKGKEAKHKVKKASNEGRGWFGRKKREVENDNLVDKAGNAIGGAVKTVQHKAGEVADDLGGASDDTKGWFGKKANNVQNVAGDAVHAVQHKAGDAYHAVGHAAQDAKHNLQHKQHDVEHQAGKVSGKLDQAAHDTAKDARSKAHDAKKHARHSADHAKDNADSFVDAKRREFQDGIDGEKERQGPGCVIM